MGTVSQEKYKKNNIKVYGISCYKTTDKDILEKLESVPSKSGYIKSLIRKDMKKAKEAGEWW